MVPAWLCPREFSIVRIYFQKRESSALGTLPFQRSGREGEFLRR